MLKQAKMGGWSGWCGGKIYTAPKGMALLEVDHLLQQKAKETDTGAAILHEHGALYGWGYTNERYLDGPYFWPFFIESDQFRDASGVWKETRKKVPDLERIQELEVQREKRKKNPLDLP